MKHLNVKPSLELLWNSHGSCYRMIMECYSLLTFQKSCYGIFVEFTIKWPWNSSSNLKISCANCLYARKHFGIRTAYVSNAERRRRRNSMEFLLCRHLFHGISFTSAFIPWNFSYVYVCSMELLVFNRNVSFSWNFYERT